MKGKTGVKKMLGGGMSDRAGRAVMPVRPAVMADRVGRAMKKGGKAYRKGGKC